MDTAITRPPEPWRRKYSRPPAIPNVFPDQIAAGLKPWTPLKDYAHTPWFGNDDGKLAVNVEVPEGNYDPVLGMSYVQIAREGLGYQKSQTGGGMIPKAGALDSTIIASARWCPSRTKRLRSSTESILR